MLNIGVYIEREVGDDITVRNAADTVDLLDQGALAGGNGVAVGVGDLAAIVAGVRYSAGDLEDCLLYTSRCV